MPRRRSVPRLIARVASLVGLLAAPRGAAADAPPSFERHVRPIFKEYCLDCHGGGEKLKGGLDLRLKRFAAQGGDGGPAVVPGRPAESLLVQRVKAGEMPPGEKKLSPAQIATFEQWIAAGAPTDRPEPDRLPPGIDITPEERAYWFFQPLRRPTPPAGQPADRARTPIDAFVLAKLREKGLTFTLDADRRTLIRRAAFDLTGLPPSPEEVEAFVNDPAPDAYERLIDRLLASPHYGERWGRHWLDVAGYADSDGNGGEDTPRPHAWRYRDWVIRALNADLPLDQFITDQLAGDEQVPLPWKDLTPAQLEKLAATGFLRTAPDATAGGGDPTADANQVVADTLKIVSSSLLGLTVGCAQCHDHKYDPIPHTDYFRLRAVFEPALDPKSWRRPAQRLVSLYTDADRAKAAAVDAAVQKLQTAHDAKQRKFLAAAVEKELAKFPDPLRGQLRAAYGTPADRRTAEHKKLLDAHPSVNLSPGVLYQYDPAAAEELKKDQAGIAAERAKKPVEEFVSVLSEVPGAVPTTTLFYRGDYRQPRQAITPGDLTIAAPDGARRDIPEKDPIRPTTGRRLAWAKHLTSGTHPLLGRVLANRLWLHHFGRGLVDTPGDFGVLGQRPTHPDLLDWLATELPRQGWSLKGMHRLVMTSTVYRQSSRTSPAARAIDTDAAWYSRYPLRRLDAEAVRDGLLAAAGRLDRTPFGPPVPVDEDAGGQVVAKDDTPRRSVYLQVRRTRPESLLAAFDAPAMAPNCDRRTPSTAPTQALMLMNSAFVRQQAEALARRARAGAGAALPEAAPLADQFPRPAETWRYGIGEYDPADQRVRFAPLPHWTGAAWQGGPAVPDPKLGYALLTAAGGHAGTDAARSPVRRWGAPRDGVLTITGQLGQGMSDGDGVRGRVVSGRAGLLGEWVAKSTAVPTAVKAVPVKAGDTIDFVTDCRADVTGDSFGWAVKLTLTPPAGGPAGWDSAADFRGPAGPPPLPALAAVAWRLAYQRPATADELALAARFLLDQTARPRELRPADPELAALTDLCQQLLASNEFLYVD